MSAPSNQPEHSGLFAYPGVIATLFGVVVVVVFLGLLKAEADHPHAAPHGADKAAH